MEKCEHCGCIVPDDNVERVCAYQVDYDTPVPNYKGALTCTCCDQCRASCHEVLLKSENEKQDQ